MPQDPTQQNTLDPQVVNLAKAIRQTESGGDFTKPGKSGEYGAYQFLPNTWDNYAKQAGVNVPLSQATPEQQNEVAYKKLKQWKDAGYNVGQISSMWNAGEGKPNAYIDGNAGTNSQGVNYDTSAYAKKVAENYQALKGQNQTTVQGTNAPAQQDTPPSLLPNVGGIATELGGNVSNRIQQGSQALTDVGQGLATGDYGKAASGALQTAGAAAGGIGDVLNAGLELIPGVQGVEKGISHALGDFAQTPSGQSIVQGISSLAQAHPELAKNLGAIVNIASVIPMFKGLSLIKGGITDAATSALKAPLTEAAASEIRSNLTTQAARNSLSATERRGLDPISVITSDPQNLPSVVENDAGKFVYDSTKTAKGIQGGLSQDEETLQNMLDQGVKQNIGVPIENARNQVLKDITTQFKGADLADAYDAINNFFDKEVRGESLSSGRSVISINDLNDMKRRLGGQINWKNLGTSAGEIKSAAYRSLMGQVEEYAKQAGVEGVGDLNKVMGGKIEALKVLKTLDGKAVRQSKFGKVIRELGADVAGGAGELAGNQAGIPFASALAGRGLYRAVPGRIPLTAIRLLGRSGRGTVKSSLSQGLLKSGVAQGLRGLVGQQPQQ